MVYIVYNFNSDLKFSTGLVAQSVARLPLNWMVREVPGSIPASGIFPKIVSFFYKLRTKNCSKSRTKIGMSVDI